MCGEVLYSVQGVPASTTRRPPEELAPKKLGRPKGARDEEPRRRGRKEA